MTGKDPNLTKIPKIVKWTHLICYNRERLNLAVNVTLKDLQSQGCEILEVKLESNIKRETQGFDKDLFVVAITYKAPEEDLHD